MLIPPLFISQKVLLPCPAPPPTPHPPPPRPQSLMDISPPTDKYLITSPSVRDSRITVGLWENEVCVIAKHA